MDINDYEIFKTNSYTKKEINGKIWNLNKEPYLDIVLNDTCDNNCRFCIADLIHDKRHLQLEDLKTKVSKAIAEFGVKEVLLLGGEPALSNILIHSIKYLRKCNLNKIIMTTNGNRLVSDLSFADEVFTAGLTHLNISIMNLDMRKRKQIAGGKQVFELRKLKDLITLAHLHHINVRVNCNIFKDNIDTIEDMICFHTAMSSLGIDSVKYSPLFSVDNFSVVNKTTAWVKAHILTPEEYEKLFTAFEQKVKTEQKIQIIVNQNQFGFVKNTVIPLSVPIIMNWNFGKHTGMMEKVTKEKQINNLKLLPTGDLSLSWNREDQKWFLN